MKVSLVFFSLLVISCSSKQKKEDTVVQNEEPATETIHETKDTTTATEKSFEEVQDSLRKVLLDSKPNENLKSSMSVHPPIPNPATLFIAHHFFSDTPPCTTPHHLAYSTLLLYMQTAQHSPARGPATHLDTKQTQEPKGD